MGSFANSLFKIMLGWLQTAVSAVWSAFTSENGSSVFNWIGRHWIMLAGILCVIGLVTDLCVYIFRWKPYKVWKSFFTGNKDTDIQQPTTNQISTGSLKPKARDGGEINRSFGETAVHVGKDISEEYDFSRWEADNAEDAGRGNVQTEKNPATITNAGYIVPADSPYRRPAEEMNQADETEQNDDYLSRAERKEPTPIAPRRRKRINVSELFTDPEEELHQFDAPQHVIDSRKAYRDPVYPRGWKKE